MLENGPKFRNPKEELFAYWNQYPVVIASQSEYRKSQLGLKGFKEVEQSIPVPESVEDTRAQELNLSQGIPSHYASKGHDVVRHIAGAKVQYVINNQTIRSDAIVLAFDTAPLLWYYDATEEKFVFEHMEKPKTIEDGKRMIARTIAVTASGCQVREKRIIEMQSQFAALPKDIRDETIANLAATLDIGTIEIVSAAAGSFPNNRSRILGFSEEVSLFSQAIYAMRNDNYALDILSDKVIALMGDRVTKISGGIDYSDSEIRDLLQISELKINILEGTTTGTDHYEGLSEIALTILLANARANI